jgi:hypothetical protein
MSISLKFCRVGLSRCNGVFMYILFSEFIHNIRSSTICRGIHIPKHMKGHEGAACEAREMH